MLSSLQALAILLPGYIRVGGLHLPVYGLFAAFGLVASLWLSQQTARQVGIPPDKLWDAGVFAVVAAFIASRVLLIAFDLHSFLKFPLLMLALPSLTYGGMLLTAGMVRVWLHWKRLPVRDVLDAWAPCAALLAAVLSIGHFFEGTDAGMPTRLPWGVITPGDSVLGRVHPVQIYAALIALALCVVLFRRLQHRSFAGEISALALMLGGTAAFLLDMLRQPVESDGDAFLDPGQFVALAAILVGAFMYRGKREPVPELTRTEVAEMLESFVADDNKMNTGRVRPFDHEKIYYGTFTDPLLLELKERFPDLWEGPHWGVISQEESNRIFLDYARQLRSDGPNSTKDPI